MPALQVRDFPDELYEQLKVCATLEHRSIAQQTIAFVEEGLNARNASHYWDGKTLHRLDRAPRMIDFDTEVARKARIEQRKTLFAEIEKLEWKGSKPTAEDIVRTVHEGREDRDRRILDSCGLSVEGFGEGAKL